jgi:transcription elongation factor Elf1
MSKKVEMRELRPDDGPFDDVWECPVCGTQMATMSDRGKLGPPTCGIGHVPCEMEQKQPAAWRRLRAGGETG